MDTKSRNIKYSSGFKVAAVIIICLSMIGIIVCGSFLLYNKNELTSDSYYETNKYKEEFGTLIHNIVELNVVLKDEENIRNSFSEVSIPNYLNRLDKIEAKLPNLVNFKYYVKNLENNESTTNIDYYDPIKLIKEQDYYVYFDKNNSYSDYYTYYQYDINKMLENTPYEIYATLIEPLQPGDVFYNDFTEYNEKKSMFPLAITILSICSVLFIGLLFYLIIVIGRREKDGDIYLRTIDKLYIDVHTIIVFILAFLSIIIAAGNIGGYNNIWNMVIIGVILIVDLLIGLNYIFSIIRQFKARQLLKNTLIFQIYKAIKKLAINCFNGKMFRPWIVLLLFLYSLVNGFLIYIIFAFRYGLESFIVFLIFLAINIGISYMVLKSLNSLAHIMTIAKEIADGNLDYDFDIKNMSIAFSGFAENIKNIQGGMKTAVNEAVKGEQMKIALITNVSHDLKTPLTSIITYTDLLKNEEIPNEKALEYIKVIDEKSLRLKQLIEDLMEASKASTGNLVVKEEELDLNELILQAYGEFEDKFKEVRLDVRINSEETKTLVKADGSHMWRIVENLFVNTIKYSLSESRVYIEINKIDTYGILTIKNISKSPLDITPEQLFERFVRGDESRTTEGSGLGLSIAKSLTTLQNGKLDIELDGDLFKVIVKIPLVLT